MLFSSHVKVPMFYLSTITNSHDPTTNFGSKVKSIFGKELSHRALQKIAFYYLSNEPWIKGHHFFSNNLRWLSYGVFGNLFAYRLCVHAPTPTCVHTRMDNLNLQCDAKCFK